MKIISFVYAHTFLGRFILFLVIRCKILLIRIVWTVIHNVIFAVGCLNLLGFFLLFLFLFL